MNPFTQFLAQPLTAHKFLSFVKKWDVIEQIVVNTFREQGNLREDMKDWQKVRGALRREYPMWIEQLAPFWRQALLNGKPAPEDPFLALLNYDDVGAFRQNWRAMQTLPIAREAINRLLMALQSEK